MSNVNQLHQMFALVVTFRDWRLRLSFETSYERVLNVGRVIYLLTVRTPVADD